MLAEGLKVLASRSMWLSPSFFCPLASQISVRSLNSNRAVVTKVRGIFYLRYYRVFHQLPDLGWVDFDFGSSDICWIWLRQIEFWKKWLSSWTSWRNIANISQPNPSARADGAPCKRITK